MQTVGSSNKSYRCHANKVLVNVSQKVASVLRVLRFSLTRNGGRNVETVKSYPSTHGTAVKGYVFLQLARLKVKLSNVRLSQN